MILVAACVTSACSESLNGPLVDAAQPGDATSPVADDSDDGQAEPDDADAAATLDADNAPALAPVRVIRGEPAQDGGEWDDLTIEGTHLEAYEGHVVTVRIGLPDRPPERLGSGQARIEDGAFTLTIPRVWERDFYKPKAVLIDVNDDGLCSANLDVATVDYRAVSLGKLLVRPEATGQLDFPRLAPSSSETCRLFNTPWPTE